MHSYNRKRSYLLAQVLRRKTNHNKELVAKAAKENMHFDYSWSQPDIPANTAEMGFSLN